jgi:tetratricopeptide (TPR) repeat protein
MDHPCRPAALFNLATAKFLKCQADGKHLDLDIPIALFEEALDLRPTGHPDRPITQFHLAVSLLSRFRKRGFQTDADTAEELLSDVLDICQANSHIYRAALLATEALVRHLAGSIDKNELRQEWPATSMLPSNQLADLAERSMCRDDPHALDEAISLHYDALRYYDTTHACRGQLLYNQGAMLRTRFDRRGSDEDLDEAIILHREALALRPVGHTDRSWSLDSLATQLSTRFDHRGNDEDLDDAITLYREALALRPAGHIDRSWLLDSLATQLSTRFDHRGNDEDLDEAITLQREALALRPVGHTDRSWSLDSLATQLSTRFDHRGNGDDLDDAITLQRESLALCPVSHTDRSWSIDNLATQLSTRFGHRGNDRDLDDAITLQREALALRAAGHPDRSPSLNNLATQLSARFNHRHNGEDLHESREHLRCALTLLTQHDPRQLKVHLSLATVYLSFYHSGLDGTAPDEDADSLNAAMHHFKAAANVVSGGLLSRLRASLCWVRHADQHTHGTQLEAYATSMQLLDAYMSATASVSSRHNAMKEFPSALAVDAASCALRIGDVCRAIELLEQGRTLIWTQIARVRTPLDSLQNHSDHAVALMKKFRDLSSLLDKPPASNPEGIAKLDVEAEATRYRRLVEEWNATVEEIRMIEGFSRFLIPPLIL